MRQKQQPDRQESFELFTTEGEVAAQPVADKQRRPRRRRPSRERRQLDLWASPAL